MKKVSHLLMNQKTTQEARVFSKTAAKQLPLEAARWRSWHEETAAGRSKRLPWWMTRLTRLLEKESAGRTRVRMSAQRCRPLHPLHLQMPPACVRCKSRQGQESTSVCVRVCVKAGGRHVCKSKHRPRRVCLCNSCCGYDNTDGNSDALCACVCR